MVFDSLPRSAHASGCRVGCAVLRGGQLSGALHHDLDTTDRRGVTVATPGFTTTSIQALGGGAVAARWHALVWNLGHRPDCIVTAGAARIEPTVAATIRHRPSAVACTLATIAVDPAPGHRRPDRQGAFGSPRPQYHQWGVEAEIPCVFAASLRPALRRAGRTRSCTTLQRRSRGDPPQASQTGSTSCTPLSVA